MPSGPLSGGTNGFTFESATTDIVSAKTFADRIRIEKTKTKKLFRIIPSLFRNLLRLFNCRSILFIADSNICPCCHHAKINYCCNAYIGKDRALFTTMRFAIKKRDKCPEYKQHSEGNYCKPFRYDLQCLIEEHKVPF